MEELKQPKNVNILVTGTPGTGKTTFCEMLAEATGLRHLNVGTIVKEKSCHEGRNDEFDCFILDEDKLCDEMEDTMVEGGNIVDFHSCNFFPERWFHLVIVLRVDNSILYPRLEKRGYSQKKVQENMEAEIMQVCKDEAFSSYDKNIIVELQNDDLDQLEANVERCMAWLEKHNSKQ